MTSYLCSCMPVPGWRESRPLVLGNVKSLPKKITNKDVQTLADRVMNIAREAGAIQLKLYEGSDKDLRVRMKTDEQGYKSPLTAADLLSAEKICERLEQLNGNIPIVIEESKMEDFSTRKQYGYFWCVDPLDGTKEFIKRKGEFTVNIGLIYKNTPVFGVVYVPAKDIMYYGGTLGDGSFGSWKITPQNPIPQPVTVATFSPDEENLTVVMSASHSNQATNDFVKRFKNPKKESRGSSLKLLMVAEGSAHCYPRLNGTCEWDTAAAHAIVNGAGGSVEVHHQKRVFKNGKPLGLVDNPDGGKHVWYNKENVKNPYFVVWGKRQQRAR